MGLSERFRNLLGYPEDEYEEDDDSLEDSAYSQGIQQDSVPARRNELKTEAVQVVLVKPEQFEEARGIATHIIQNRIVIINFEVVSKEVRKRLVDFIGGVTYAKSGHLGRVSENTFIITPYNVEYGEDMMGLLTGGAPLF